MPDGPLTVEDQSASPTLVARLTRLGNLPTFSSLRFRDYRLLWLGQAGTSAGQWMDQVARSWLIYQLTGSPLELGAVGAARAVPILVFGVAAGVVADRYGRKAQLIISQVVNAVLNLALATLVVTGRVQPWHVYVTALLVGTAQAFQQPARQALISDLVGKEYLANAVALNSAVFNLMRSLGPALAGALIAAFGVGGSYYVQAGVFVWASIWTAQMRVPGEPGLLGLAGAWRGVAGTRATGLDGGSSATAAGVVGAAKRRRAEGSFFASLREGLQYLRENRLILSLMFLGLAPVVLAMPYVSLLPIFALDVLQVGSVGQGLLLSSVGVGALLGALGIASLGQFRRKGLLLLGGAIVFGLSLIAFSRSTWMPLSLLCLFIAGVSNASYTSQNQTIIQTLTPPRLRGRILSIYMLNRGLMPLGSLLAGGLAAWLGGPWAVTLMGASCALLAIGVALKTPAIRELDI